MPALDSTRTLEEPIFIGGASEDSESLREVESWICEQNHEAWPWDQPGTFTIGMATFPRLIEISREIQAAVLIFSPNDNVYYRGDAKGQPRDNVLIEYGIFASAIGPEKCAIALVGDSKIATDLAGISYLDFRGKRKARGRMELNIWLRSLSTTPIDPAIAKQKAANHQLREQNENLQEALAFEVENSRKLKTILAEKSGIDFSDLSSDKYWKLLFDYPAVNDISDKIKCLIKTPQDLRRLLADAQVKKISDAITWSHADAASGDNFNPQENGKFCRKTLRAFKMLGESSDIQRFAENSNQGILSAFNEATEKYLAIKNI